MTESTGFFQVHDVEPDASPTRPDLRVIFEEHFDHVWNTLRRLGVHQADLEDLAHEVFLRVHARLDDFDAARPIRPWLCGFALRVAAEHRRLARHRIEVFGSPVEALDPVPPADERIHAGERRALVEAALAALDFDRRAILVLHDVDEIPVPEIARGLGIPLNTAYSRLRVAREELAAALKRLSLSRSRRIEEVCRD
jgi:RNA polymerase sigma-70 factor (ECF subfamily)